MGQDIMKIDIFGNGKHVYEESELPDTLVTEDGLYKRNNIKLGISYTLAEPSESYKDKLKSIEQQDVKGKDRIQELEDRIKAIELKLDIK